SVEIYNPSTGLWAPARNMLTARHSHTATLLANGRVLVAGGFSTTQNASLRSAEIYDPATNTWTSTGLLNTSRDTYTATLLPSGQVLVAGGVSVTGSNGFVVSSAELYSPLTNSWTPTGDLGVPRFNHTATLQPLGNVLVAGGVAGDDTVSA